jgi:hypothetical protein
MVALLIFAAFIAAALIVIFSGKRDSGRSSKPRNRNAHRG